MFWAAACRPERFVRRTFLSDDFVFATGEELKLLANRLDKQSLITHLNQASLRDTKDRSDLNLRRAFSVCNIVLKQYTLNVEDLMWLRLGKNLSCNYFTSSFCLSDHCHYDSIIIMKPRVASAKLVVYLPLAFC